MTLIRKFYVPRRPDLSEEGWNTRNSCNVIIGWVISLSIAIARSGRTDSVCQVFWHFHEKKRNSFYRKQTEGLDIIPDQREEISLLPREKAKKNGPDRKSGLFLFFASRKSQKIQFVRNLQSAEMQLLIGSSFYWNRYFRTSELGDPRKSLALWTHCANHMRDPVVHTVSRDSFSSSRAFGVKE